jgi:glycolate oxidase FAD binding subunit
VPEVGEILRLAALKNSSIVPRGGGTKIDCGNSPSRLDAVLNLSHMDRILEIDLENLTITLEAGVKLQTIQENLARHHCFIPLDPPFADATIGGILSTNSSGPKRLLYGSARDITLGVKLVLAGGKIVKAGGKTVKNVSGYDMTKLYIGSCGTLGIIAEATLRLLPAPEREVILILPCRDVAQAQATAFKIIHSDLLPSSLMLFNPKAAAILPPSITSAFPKGVLLFIGIEGPCEAVEAQIQRIRLLQEEEGIADFQIFQDSPAAAIWKALQGIHQLLLDRPPLAVSCKVSTSLSQSVAFFHKAESLSTQNAVEAALLGHLGTGIINLFLESKETEPPAVSTIAGIIADLRKEAEAAGGNLVIESAPPVLKKNISVWGRPGPSFLYMKAIKTALDPMHLLNPGRFYGDL